MGSLGGEFVEGERGEKADRGIGNSLGYFRKTVVLSHLRSRECVHAAAHPHEVSAANEAKQVFASDPFSLDVSRAENRLLAGSLKDAGANRDQIVFRYAYRLS